MRKLLFTCVLISSFAYVSGQSFDWNLRGGINIMDSKTSGEDVSVLLHAGAQAGIRITNFGFYGELLYSLNANQDGGDPVAYFVPGALMKAYMRKLIFGEIGIGVLTMSGSSDNEDTLNPDGMLIPFGGLGIHFSKIELSFRSNVKQSYPAIHVTLAVKF